MELSNSENTLFFRSKYRRFWRPSSHVDSISRTTCLFCWCRCWSAFPCVAMQPDPISTAYHNTSSSTREVRISFQDRESIKHDHFESNHSCHRTQAPLRQPHCHDHQQYQSLGAFSKQELQHYSWGEERFPICLAPFEDVETVRKLICLHLFHFEVCTMRLHFSCLYATSGLFKSFYHPRNIVLHAICWSLWLSSSHIYSIGTSTTSTHCCRTIVCARCP